MRTKKAALVSQQQLYVVLKQTKFPIRDYYRTNSYYEILLRVLGTLS